MPERYGSVDPVSMLDYAEAARHSWAQFASLAQVDWKRTLVEAVGHRLAMRDAGLEIPASVEPAESVYALSDQDVRCALQASEIFVDWVEHVCARHLCAECQNPMYGVSGDCPKCGVALCLYDRDQHVRDRHPS